jgi:hypothetical protein
VSWSEWAKPAFEVSSGLGKTEVMKMVITILEAQIASDKWEVLKRAYGSGAETLPPPIVETFLAQSATDPTVWRIMTVWRSREALDDYRQSVETPEGVLMFRAAGAEPTLSIFDIHVHAQSQT